jgi:hypothetical protein
VKAFAELSTPLVADGCIRTGVPLRAAPPGIAAVIPGHRIACRVLPARHYGKHQIGQTEREQARRIRSGETLRQQTAFDDYLARRAADPSYTFRRHLRRIGGAIEE